MKTRLIAIGSAALFLAVLTFYALEFDHLNRTLSAGILARNAALAGLGVGLAAGGLLARRVTDKEDRAPAFFGAVFVCLFFGPLAGSLSNRLLAGDAVSVNVEFHLEEAYHAELYGFLRGGSNTPVGYRSFFYIDGRMRKIQTRKPIFQAKYRGDIAPLPLRKGFWGFYFVPALRS